MTYATGLVGFVCGLDTSLSHQRKESQLRKVPLLPGCIWIVVLHHAIVTLTKIVT